jgi:hypothetical protein
LPAYPCAALQPDAVFRFWSFASTWLDFFTTMFPAREPFWGYYGEHILLKRAEIGNSPKGLTHLRAHP